MERDGATIDLDGKILIADRLNSYVPTLFPLPGFREVEASRGTLIVMARSGHPVTEELVRSLTDAGYEVTLWDSSDRNAKPVEQLASIGAKGLVLLAPTLMAEDMTGFAYEAFRKNVLDPYFAFFKLATSLSAHEQQPFVLAIVQAHLPLTAFFTGAVKCLARERPDVRAKTLVFHGYIDVAVAVEETACAAPASLTGEIHYRDGRLHRRELIQVDTGTVDAAGLDALVAGREDPLIVLVTGGARGIVPVLLDHLARQCPCKFVLTGRTANDEPTFTREELADERGLLRRLLSSDDEPSPAEAKQRIEAARHRLELAETLSRLNTVAALEYRICDVTHPESLERVIEETLRLHGRLDGVIHGAGVDCNREMARHTREDLERVVSTKVMPLVVFARKLDFSKLAFFVGLSSAASIFGNIRQSSYAGANAVVEAFVDHVAGPRMVAGVARALCYSAWEGGMVTEGLKRAMASLGLSCIPNKVGKGTLVQALSLSMNQGSVLFVPPDPFFTNLIEREARERAYLDELYGRTFVDEVRSIDFAGVTSHVCSFDDEDRAGLLDHRFHGVPVVPCSLALSLFQRLSQTLYRTADHVEICQYRAREMVCLPDPKASFLVDLEHHGADCFRFSLRQDSRVRSVAELRFHHEMNDIERQLPSLNKPLEQPWKHGKLYGSHALALGERYRLVYSVRGLWCDGIETTFLTGGVGTPFQSILEAITQTNALYCLATFGTPSFPYTIENVTVRSNVAKGVRCTVRLRVEIVSALPGLCPTMVEVRDEQGNEIASGGPWTNAYFSQTRVFALGPAQCCMVSRSAIARFESALGRSGLSFYEPWKAEGDDEVPAAFDGVVAVKEALCSLFARDRDELVDPRKVTVTFSDDGDCGLRLSDGPVPEMPAVAFARGPGMTVAALSSTCQRLRVALVALDGRDDDEWGVRRPCSRTLWPIAVRHGAKTCRHILEAVKQLLVEEFREDFAITFHQVRFDGISGSLSLSVGDGAPLPIALKVLEDDGTRNLFALTWERV